MKLIQERMWKKSIEGPVIDKFHKAMAIDDPENEEEITNSINALVDLLKEILRIDPEFEDTYNDILDEISMLGTPDSFEDTEDQTAYEQWVENFNYILSMMYDYCDDNDIWIDPDKLQEDYSDSDYIDDGWDYDYINDTSGLLNTLDDIDQLNYEIKNTVKGTYSNAKTYKELGRYIKTLAQRLVNAGEKVYELDQYYNESIKLTEDDRESLVTTQDLNILIDFLSNYDQAFKDFKYYFKPKYNEYNEVISDGLDKEEVFAWLKMHTQLYKDFLNYIKNEEGIKEGMNKSIRAWGDEEVQNQNGLVKWQQALEDFLNNHNYEYDKITCDIHDYGTNIVIMNPKDIEEVAQEIEDEYGFRSIIEDNNLYVDVTEEYEDENGDIRVRVVKQVMKESTWAVDEIYFTPATENKLDFIYQNDKDKYEEMEDEIYEATDNIIEKVFTDAYRVQNNILRDPDNYINTEDRKQAIRKMYSIINKYYKNMLKNNVTEDFDSDLEDTRERIDVWLEGHPTQIVGMNFDEWRRLIANEVLDKEVDELTLPEDKIINDIWENAQEDDIYDGNGNGIVTD